ncbi:hypothetical protein WA026_023517 [Henosepilachna vigintioctopunctata]|uniref:TFIIS N-terminal domain-containing protein n=1 Tax=Henosepilachna vigintioctopunctata TaxID=420089 RepID=A0AAW1TTN4_9CUCU
MTESGENLYLAINRYQRDLEKYLKRQDAAKMLHKLRRLDKLPIEMCHLEETLIGRTVNNLQIFGGEIGEAAKSLVEKWQKMVINALDNEDDESSKSDDRNDLQEKKYKERNEKKSHSCSVGNTVHHEGTKNSDSENTDDMKINEIEHKERKSYENIEDNHESKGESKTRSKCSSENDEIDAVKISNSDESLLEAICHYQRGLERNLRKKDELKILHKLGRLDKLPIELCHLEETLIGLTVNSLRIFGGEVGEASRSLVEKWQEIVINALDKDAEESSKSGSNSRYDCQEKKHKYRNKKRSHSSSEGNSVDHEIKNSAIMNDKASESGISSEDSLGMCGPPPSKKIRLSKHERLKYSSPSEDSEKENAKYDTNIVMKPSSEMAILATKVGAAEVSVPDPDARAAQCTSSGT